MAFRSEDYPNLAAYLERLPDGADSYPKCQAKCSLLRAVVAEFPTGGSTRGLPDELRLLLDELPPPSVWIPETHFVAAHFALMDIFGMGEDELLQLTYAANRKLAHSRMYRALTRLASPGVLVKGASMSWSFIHKGSTLRAEAETKGALLTLRHPPHLYPSLGHRSIGRGFTAALEASNGKNPHVRVLSSTPDHAKLQVSWD